VTLAFTLCSNNYLAQAKTLGDSFRKHHPGKEFIIGLVDTISSSIDYSMFSEFTILPVSDLNIPEFESMERKYSIVELNTSVKPFYFTHLFSHQKAHKIIYLDPDIEVFSAMEEVLELLNSYNIIITPQNCSPIDDGHSPSDIHLLGTGIFNLGFIALSDAGKLSTFLGWWKQRLLKYGFADERNNMFFDQVWINLVPAFFDNYYVLKHPGYNMSPSNLHERRITGHSEACWLINENYLLRFYHFSGFKFSKPGFMCGYSERFTFEDRPDVLPLYRSYIKTLEENKITELAAVEPFYCRKLDYFSPKEHKIKRGIRRISRALKVLAGKA
jgi:hypothetical protein